MKTMIFLMLTLFACSSSPKSQVEIGETLRTPYFDITLNNFELKNSIDGYYPERGNIFLTLNLTYKNVNDSSRVISDQGIGIEKDGHKAWFERDYLIEVGGYGEKFVTVNPGESKIFKQAYQLPIGLIGDANYYTSRTNGKELTIHLGEIKI